MVQPVTDNVEFLTQAKRAVIELAQMKAQEDQLIQEEKRLEKSLELERKAVADNITMTIKKRAEAISSSYDQEISKGQDRLKKARAKREKAKSQGVKERIAEETAALRDQNRDLRLQMKTLFQKGRVPRFCSTDFYYSLYFPRWFREIITMLLTVIICFLVVPYGIYLLIPKKNTIVLIVVYFIAVLLFGGLYILIGNKTKLSHLEALKAGRSIKDQIRSNNRKIKSITHSIQKDRNEAVYNLQKYDDEIAHIEQELTVTANKKKDALNTFETVTKNIIADEITSNNKDRISKLEESHDSAHQTLMELQTSLNNKRIYITDHYEVYLGKEFLQPQKIDQLLDAMQNGTALNLTEAIDYCRNAIS